MSDNDEPCMCGTPFTCMADEHDHAVANLSTETPQRGHFERGGSAWSPDRTWTVDVEVADHGVWDPRDPILAADIIHAVNLARIPTDAKPKVEVWYDGSRVLSVEIDGQGTSLHPGEHLVEARLPRQTFWSSMTAEELDAFRPVPS